MPTCCRAPALDQRDERVAGDLLGEAGAPGAQHAALPVEQHLRGDVDRLGEGALRLHEPALAAAVGHRLVLQRALAALVADRAVERVVDQQELHDPCCALSATGERGLGAAPPCRRRRPGCRRPAASGSAWPLPASATSTRHWRQAPTGASSGWSQNRGICTPICSAARITRVSLGTLTSTSSMVRVTRSAFSTAPRPAGWWRGSCRGSRGSRRGWTQRGRTGSRPR